MAWADMAVPQRSEPKKEISMKFFLSAVPRRKSVFLFWEGVAKWFCAVEAVDSLSLGPARHQSAKFLRGSSGLSF